MVPSSQELEPPGNPGRFRQRQAVEFATLEWVDWFNHRRLLEPVGNMPSAEAEARYYAQIVTQPKFLREPGTVQLTSAEAC